MENNEIIRLLRLTGLLMELHEENAFKIRGYQNAAFNLEKCTANLSSLSLEELENLEGVGKSLASKLHEIITTGSFKELASLLEKTPAGVVEMLGIKGLGPKKVKVLWKEVGIETKEDLLLACNENRISSVKGFGEKTQEAIKQSLLFAEAQKERFLYAEAEPIALALDKKLKEAGVASLISLAGDIRRKMEIVDEIRFILGSEDPLKTLSLIDQVEGLEKDEKDSGPFTWRGRSKDQGVKVEMKIYPEKDFSAKLFIHSASKNHLLASAKDGKTFMELVSSGSYPSEEAIYEAAGIPFIVPEMREGLGEVEQARENKLPSLITYMDLKGVLHNHSTYSDGVHTLEQMALFCKELGFDYLGISDHSKSAFYANGLHERRIIEQHQEIDALNQKLAPFKIFKGIESDILADGELDYADDVLASFDFIVASIHSNLKMSEDKATQRLIRAIENPFTTILGHPTGRLLLKREGYPINHKKVIEACAANQVVIEINAHPYRLDMDWRWVKYALDKGVMIAINPDAHEMNGYYDMHYGVNVGRKAGLTKEMTFNALGLKEISAYFEKKKEAVSK